MPRRPPLTEKLRAEARASLYPVVYMSEQGKILLGMMQRGDEPDQAYLGRVFRLDREHKEVDFEIFSSFSRRQQQAQNDVEEIKASLLLSLDRLTDSLISLGERFLAAAEDGDPERLEALAAQGAPVNYHDPRNGATALHYVAAHGARRAFRALLRIGGLDFLARDNRGRLASEMAGVYGESPAMERLLFRKEIQQAREKGIPLEQLYRRNAVPRSTPSRGP